MVIKLQNVVIGVALQVLTIPGFSQGSQSTQQKRFPELHGPYLGQKPPGIKPDLFAPGVISRDEDIINTPPIFSSNGEKAIWFRVEANAVLGHIMSMKMLNGRWAPAETLPFEGNYPALSPDGKKLFFASHKPGNDESPWRIWYAENNGEFWETPRLLNGPINAFTANAPSITKDGTLYFASSRPGGKGELDIYRSRLENGEYTEPENLGDQVNTSGYDVHPWISPDEDLLIYATQGWEDSYGNMDLYISFRKSNGTWTKAKNLGSLINTEKAELYALVSPDNRWLFFTSARSGKKMVYWVSSGIFAALSPL